MAVVDSGKPARTDFELLADADGISARALHAAHRPHAPDPRAPGAPRPSAGGRRALRRRAGARHGAPGAACARTWRSRIRSRGAPLAFRLPRRRPTSPRPGAVVASASGRLRRACRLRYNRPPSGAIQRPWRSQCRLRIQCRRAAIPRGAPDRRGSGDEAEQRRRPRTVREARDPVEPGTRAAPRPRRRSPPEFDRVTRPGPGDVNDTFTMNTQDAKRVLETALICAEPAAAAARRCASCSTTKSAPTRCAAARRAGARLGGPRRRAGGPRQRLALPEPPRDARVPRPPAPREAAASIRAPCSRRWPSLPTASR